MRKWMMEKERQMHKEEQEEDEEMEVDKAEVYHAGMGNRIFPLFSFFSVFFF